MAFILTLVLGITMALTRPAYADLPRPSGVITITSITPAQLKTGEKQTITISGSLRNNSPTTLYAPTAHLWFHSKGLTSFKALSSLLDLPWATPIGTTDPQGVPLSPTAPLAPGAQLPFTVKLNSEKLNLEKKTLAVIVGVEVTASASQTQPATVVARSRAIISTTTRPFSLTNINFLTAPPGSYCGGKFVSDRLREAITGPLTQLAQSFTTSTSATVLDPALYDAATKLVNSPKPAGKEFLVAVDELARSKKLWLTHWGNPNLQRIPKAFRDKALRAAASLVPSTLQGLPTLSITDDEHLRMAAHSEVLLLSPGKIGRIFWLHPKASWSPLSPERPKDSLTLFNLAAEPWPEVNQVADEALRQDDLRQKLTTAPDQQPSRDLYPIILAGYSANFRSQEDSLEYPKKSAVMGFRADGIHFKMSPSFVIAEGSSQLPVTISNPTTLPIYVRLEFHSENPVRLTIPNSALVRVGAGESETIRISPHASDNGITTVRAQLATADGTTIANVATTEITTTIYGRVGWILIVFSGAVVLGGTVWRIRKVRREREASEPSQ